MSFITGALVGLELPVRSVCMAALSEHQQLKPMLEGWQMQSQPEVPRLPCQPASRYASAITLSIWCLSTLWPCSGMFRAGQHTVGKACLRSVLCAGVLPHKMLLH